MAGYRSSLPHVTGRLVLTDGGIEISPIGCAHPTHFEDVLAGEGRWLGRMPA